MIIYWFEFHVNEFICATFLQHWRWICSYDGRWSKVSFMHHSTKEWKTSGCSLWNHQLLSKKTSTMGRTSYWWGPLCSLKSNIRRTKGKTIGATIVNWKKNKNKQKIINSKNNRLNTKLLFEIWNWNNCLYRHCISNIETYLTNTFNIPYLMCGFSNETMKKKK